MSDGKYGTIQYSIPSPSPRRLHDYPKLLPQLHDNYWSVPNCLQEAEDEAE